jgi:hypothetical protein
MTTVQWTAIYPDGPGSPYAAGGASGGAAENPDYPGLPAGTSPVHRDVTISAAGTTNLWVPSPGKRFVLLSAFVSTDTAMRVALVDDIDAQGRRPVDGYFGANGGASPNLIPAPYVSVAPGNVLRVVTGAAGNVKVRVSGYEV